MHPKKRLKIDQPPDDQQPRLSDDAAEVSDETENVDTPSLGSEQQLQRLEQDDSRSRRLAELRAKRSTELSAEEKHEKMRLTNRESAKKLRRKRTEQMQGLQAEVAALRAENATLQHRLRQATDSNMALVSVVRNVRSGGSGALDGSAVGSTSGAASAPSVATNALGSLLGLPTGLSAQSSSTQGPSAATLEALLQGMGSGSLASPSATQPPPSPLAGTPSGLAAAAAALAAQQMMRQGMPAPWPYQPPSQNRPPLPPAMHLGLPTGPNGQPLPALWPLMQQQGPSLPFPLSAALLQPQQQVQQAGQQRQQQQQQGDASGTLLSPAPGATSAAQFVAWLQALGAGLQPPMGPDSSPIVLPPPMSLNLWPMEAHGDVPMPTTLPATAQAAGMAGPSSSAAAHEAAAAAAAAAHTAAAHAGLAGLPPFLQTLLAAGLPLGAAAAGVLQEGSGQFGQALGGAAAGAHEAIQQQMALAQAHLRRQQQQQQQGQMAYQQFPVAPAHTQASAAAYAPPAAPASEGLQLQRAGTMMSCTAEVCEPLPIRTELQE